MHVLHFLCLVLQLHNGVWSFACETVYRDQPCWSLACVSFQSEKGCLCGPKMASVSFCAETVSAHSRTSNRGCRFIPRVFPSRASTHRSQRPLENRSNGLADRIKPKQNMIFWWFTFTQASLALYKWTVKGLYLVVKMKLLRCNRVFVDIWGFFSSSSVVLFVGLLASLDPSEPAAF